MAEARVVDTLFGADDQELETLVGSAEDDILALAPGVAGFILGAKGNDSILGGFEDTDPYVFAYGGKGDDTLVGRGSNDKFRGDKGEDSLFGGEGDETLYGGKDDDEIFGGTGVDSVLGGLGNDSLETDFERSDEETDTVSGGEGNDTIGHLESDFDRETNKGDWLFGDEGEDSVVGGFGDDSVVGGEGEDTLRGGNGDTTVEFLDNVPSTPFVPAGNDWVDGQDGDDFIQGGDEVSNRVLDAVFERNLPDREPGENEAPRVATDTLIGGDGADTVEGNDGDDSIRGDEGGDSLRGGDGSDTITAGPGDDRLFGDTNAFVPGTAEIDGEEVLFQRIATSGNVPVEGELQPAPGYRQEYSLNYPEGDRLGRGDEYYVAPAQLFFYGYETLDEIIDDLIAGESYYYSPFPPDIRLDSSLWDGFWAEQSFGESLRGGNDDDSLVGGASRDTLTGDGDPNTLGEDRFFYNTSEMLISVAEYTYNVEFPDFRDISVAQLDKLDATLTEDIDSTFLAPNPVQMADIVTDFQPGGGTGADTFVIQSFSYRELTIPSRLVRVAPVDQSLTPQAVPMGPGLVEGDLVNVADSFGGNQASFGQIGVDEVYDPITDRTRTLVYVELSPILDQVSYTNIVTGDVSAQLYGSQYLDPGTGGYYDPVGFDPGFDAAIAFLSNEVSPGDLSASDFEFTTGATIS